MVPTVEVRQLSKSFGRVRALVGVDLRVFSGEIVALVGDNGAGKSTLVGCVSGTLTSDAGEILHDGQPADAQRADAARSWGIETVYQDLALANELEPALNVFLGRELLLPGLLGWLGYMDRRKMRQETKALLEEFGVSLDGTTRPVSYLSGGQRQAVALARASRWVKRLMILDEPTAALGIRQRQIVLEMVRRVSESGKAVLLISHNLDDVFAVAHRIVVLRRGRLAGEFQAGACDVDDVVGAITGATLAKWRT